MPPLTPVPRQSAAQLPKAVRFEPDFHTVASLGEVEEHLRHVQRLVMQGELAATAVHEISNLLTIVLFNAGLLRERHKGDAEENRYVEPMLHAATLIATLCSQLRNLSRPTEAQSRTIDLGEAARGTFRLLEQIIARELLFSAPEDERILIHADPAHIDQVLVNLILNARDATPDEGGRIIVRVGRRTGAGSFIEVKDNGTGMTAKVKRQLFRTFFTTKPAGQGTGLGMVTVQRLIHGMGGSIKLTSRPGRGTCIRLEFPPPAVPAEGSDSAGESNRPDSSTQPG